MRNLIIVGLLAVSLAGCSTIRKGLGEYQKAADKGIGINNGPPEGAVAAPTAERRSELPTGLGGDKANASYTSPPQ